MPETSQQAHEDTVTHAHDAPIVQTCSQSDSDGSISQISEEDLHQVDRALRRLHEHVRGLIDVLPGEARSATGLARHLDVDRTTCQRLVYIASRPYTGLYILERLPGTRALRQLVDAARRVTDPSAALTIAAVAEFEAAVERLDQVISATASSQSALLRRLAATSRPLPHTPHIHHDSHTAAPQQLHHAAAEITGRHSDLWTAIYAYFPVQDDPNHLDVGRVHGLIGHHARPGAVPLTFHNFSSRDDDDTTHTDNFRPLHTTDDDHTTPDPATPSMVIPSFSSNPPPIVRAKQPGEYLVQSIDQSPHRGAKPVDLMLGTRNRMPHPALQPPRIEEVWAMINFPARRLLFDVYLHRDLARTCIPALDIHLWRPDFAAHIGDRWQTRLDSPATLQILGQGLKNAHSPHYTRHAELTQHLFQHLDADPDRFVGYRCCVEYPLWRTGYCMSFDFNTATPEDHSAG